MDQIQINDPKAANTLITTADKPIKLWSFHSHTKSCSFIFPSGAKAEFVNGKYYTEDEEKAAILTNEIIRHRNPHFYIVPGQETIMSDDLDPVNVLRKKHRAELLEELQEEMLKILASQSNDTGESKQGKLNVQSTQDLAPLAAGGDGAGIGAKLLALKKLHDQNQQNKDPETTTPPAQ